MQYKPQEFHHRSYTMPKIGRDYPHNLAVRLDPETYKCLQALQLKLDTSISDIIRKAIIQLAQEPD